MADQVEGLIRELLKLSACPYPDLTVFDKALNDPTGMLQEMLDFWDEVASEHGVDLYTELDAHIDRGDPGPNDIGELTKQRDEIAERIDKARDEYKRLTRRFFEMKVASSGEWKKHYTSKSDSREAIVRRTKSGDKESGSLFYPEVTPEMLLRVLWDLLEVRWRDCLTVHHVRLWVDVMEPVGASAGKETELACFDVDFSTPLCHAFPVQRSNKTTDDDADPWLSSDVLQGMVRPMG